jgi:hypothetical protein
VSAGVYLLTTNSYFGFSAVNCFETRVKIGGSPLDYRMFRHYFVMGGQRLNMKCTFPGKPTFLIKVLKKRAFKADLQQRMYYYGQLLIGISIVPDLLVGTMIGARGTVLFFYLSFIRCK